MIKSVLFDLDGVLLDTEGIYTEFWNGIDKIYPTGIENFAYVIKGSTLKTILSTHFESEEVRAEIHSRLIEFEKNMPFRLFEGAAHLLEDLHSRGITMAIVTSSPADKMRRVMSEVEILGRLIDTLVTDADVSRSKPDPEGYLLAAERLGALPDHFAVIEDSLAGLEAGRRAGGLVAGIATTNPRERIEPLADITVDSISELKAEDLLRERT